MIIAVIGAQNTGKTTFISDFLKEFPHFTSPTVDYRDLILSKDLKINRDGDLRSQRAIMDFLIADIIEQRKSGKDIIIDRSVIDCYVYSLWLHDYRGNIHTEDLYGLFVDALNVIDMYDMFLFCPISASPDIVIEDDGFRDTDANYRDQVDALFHDALFNDFFSCASKKTFAIGGTREERMASVRELIPVPAYVCFLTKLI